MGGEDYEWVTRVIAERGLPAATLFKDTTGICLHIQHGRNLMQPVYRREVTDVNELEKWEVAKSTGYAYHGELMRVFFAVHEFVEERFPDVKSDTRAMLEFAMTGRPTRRHMVALLAEVGVSKE